MMKFTSSIIVKIPLPDFIKKLNDYKTMKQWRQGLDSIEHVYGIPGELGSKMRLKYKFGSHEIYLIERVTHKNLPHEFHVSNENEDFYNVYKNHFTETPDGYTKWTFDCEFAAITLWMRIKTILMPRFFKDQSIKHLHDFKNFAEKDASIEEYA